MGWSYYLCIEEPGGLVQALHRDTDLAVARLRMVRENKEARARGTTVKKAWGRLAWDYYGEGEDEPFCRITISRDERTGEPLKEKRRRKKRPLAAAGKRKKKKRE